MFEVGDKVIYNDGIRGYLTATVMSVDGKDGDMDLFLIKFDNRAHGWSGVLRGAYHTNLWWVRYSARTVSPVGPSEAELD